MEHVGMSCDYITQASLKLITLLPQLPACWEYRGIVFYHIWLNLWILAANLSSNLHAGISVASVNVMGHSECKHGTHAFGQIPQQAWDTLHGSKHVTMETWKVTTVRQCP